MNGCGGHTGLNKIIASVESAAGLYTITKAVKCPRGIPNMMDAAEGPGVAAATHKSANYANGSDGVSQTMKNIGGTAGLVAVSNAIGISAGLAKVVMGIDSGRVLSPSSLASRAPKDCTRCSTLLATLLVSSSCSSKLDSARL